MDAIEFYDKERQALREELEHLRNHQMMFLTTSITASGLVLGVATVLASKPNFGIAFLFPLIILLPAWWIFFDKATTITRIVGYYRILESLILQHCDTKNFMGWENAIDELRDRTLRGEFNFSGNSNSKTRFVQLLEMLSLKTVNRYWVLCYYIFFGLSCLCVVIGIVTLESRLYVLVLLPTLLFLISAFWNAFLLWQLIYERHSYDHYEYCWVKVLGITWNKKKK